MLFYLAMGISKKCKCFHNSALNNTDDNIPQDHIERSRGKPLHEGMGSFSLAIVRKYRSSNTGYYMAHIIHVTHSFQCFKYVITCNVKCSERLLNFSAVSVKTAWTFGHKSPFHSLIFFFAYYQSTSSHVTNLHATTFHYHLVEWFREIVLIGIAW